MNWRYCKSVNSLKKLGSFKSVKSKINSDLLNITEIKSRSWDELFYKISHMRAIYLSEKPENDGDFISTANKYIFILLNTSGRNRLDNLSVTVQHYQDKSVAKKWRNELMKFVHPDICNDSRATSSMKALNEIYTEMVQ